MDITKISKLAQRLRSAIQSIPSHERPIGLRSFPRGACGDASLLLGAYLADHGFDGFEYVSANRGTYSEDNWTSHAWLAKGDLIIDLTADQFADSPSGVIILKNSVWHQSFEIDHRNAADFRDYTGPGIDELHPFYQRLKSLLV
jgi:hypothetical protein